MSWDAGVYYLGYVLALILCRGLGRIFFVPMLLNMGFNLMIHAGLFQGWDTRWLMVGYGFAFFLWVAALAGAFDRVTVVALLFVDLFVVINGIIPQIQAAGSGYIFWHSSSTIIVQVWLFSVLVVSLSAIFKSSVLSLAEKGYSELLLIPKRRFLIPIAVWAAVILLPEYLGAILPEFVKAHKFKIAGQLLVWGWVALELPVYMKYRRRFNSDE